MNTIKEYKLSWDGHRLELGKRTCIMGIINVTPDSFSDGGKFKTCDDTVAYAEKMVEDGADILDIGGESTRPFSENVSEEEETRRVVPVIEELAKRVSIPISIDTTKANVARRAIEAGASIINDIGAMKLDHEMPDIVAKYNVPIIVMHMKGTPETMQISPTYDDLIKEVKDFLEDCITLAEAKGISKSKIIVDPGIGFGKTVTHNLLLIKKINEFNSLDVPILIGSSRKSFIRTILKQNIGKELKPDSPFVETGTQASIAAAVLQGAHIVRVHDVADTYATVKIADAIKNV
jgi:dihydropteroate synthase